MNNQLEIFRSLDDYFSKIDNFNIYQYLYYSGITSVDAKIEDKDILSLMEICSEVCGDYTDPIDVGKAMAEIVYVENYITLDELKKIPSEDIHQLYFEGKLYRIEYLKEQEKELEYE